MPTEITKEDLQERAQLVRLYEASCNIEHPNDLDSRFRTSLMLKIGDKFNLRRRIESFPPPTPPTPRSK
jgi:hypothetical protein